MKYPAARTPWSPTGYATCTCRDCLELAIPTSTNEGLCIECQDAGCEAHAERECAAPGAYGSAS